MLSAYNANAAGLYIGAGYGNSDPDFVIDSLTADSTDVDPDVGAYPGWDLIEGWPTAEKGNAAGYWASEWEAGLPEKYVLDTEKNKTYSFSIGWAIPRNPFRFEFEYLKSSFSASGMMMYVYPKDGAWVEYDENDDIVKEIPTDVYDFDLVFENSEKTEFDATSYMANVLFEIPGFGNIDPYIGYGYGVTKIKGTFMGEPGYKTDDGTTTQLIAGVEYRVSDTPLILGLEYKKLKMDKAKEVLDPTVSFDYKHDMSMFKVKYDFISDKY